MWPPVNRGARAPKGRTLVIVLCLLFGSVVAIGQESANVTLTWSELPPLPDPLGVAGPFAGVHQDALIVAGGANFAQPVWDNDKVWHDAIHVLKRDGDRYRWIDPGRLPRAIAYGASVSANDGIVCIGGNDANETFGDVFLMRFDPAEETVRIDEFPALPEPCAYGAAVRVDNLIYLIAGQRGPTLDTATNQVWSLDLSKRRTSDLFHWQRLDPMPGPSRAFHLALAQHDGSETSIYVISGRRQEGETMEFLRDVWKYTPSTRTWTPCADVPRCVMAGTGAAIGRHGLIVLGGADGSLFHRADQLRDAHPGFPKQAWCYDTVADTWASAGTIPANHVTTTAVKWGETIIIPSGEIRPRVRSPKVWQVRVKDRAFSK